MCGTNPVAIDAACAELMGFAHDRIPAIARGFEIGGGGTPALLPVGGVLERADAFLLAIVKVVVARQAVFGVDVALKLIHADIAGSTGATRMAREAHAAARLGHPAMVRVFDFGWTSKGDPFLVMELVLGESLGATLRREVRMPAIQAKAPRRLQKTSRS